MAFETRRGKGRYYTRSRKVNGQVHRKYVGSGLIGEKASVHDNLLQHEAHLQRQQWREFLERHHRARQSSKAFLRELALRKAELLGAAGFHQHARGQWRFKTMGNDKNNTSETPPIGPIDLNRERAILKAAADGDASVLPELQDVLDRHPAYWKQIGDMGGIACDGWIAFAAGKNLLLAASLSRKFNALRQELAGSQPCALVALHAESVALGWLQCQYFEVLVAEKRSAKLPKGEWAALQKMQLNAQKQFHAAMHSLAALQKLLGRAVAKKGGSKPTSVPEGGRSEPA